MLAAEGHRPEAYVLAACCRRHYLTRLNRRRLAACWYYTASEAQFNEDSESVELDSDDEERAATEITTGLLGIMGTGAAAVRDSRVLGTFC